MVMLDKPGKQNEQCRVHPQHLMIKPRILGILAETVRRIRGQQKAFVKGPTGQPPNV
jgi:hypothetical protein